MLHCAIICNDHGRPRSLYLFRRDDYLFLLIGLVFDLIFLLCIAGILTELIRAKVRRLQLLLLLVIFLYELGARDKVRQWLLLIRLVFVEVECYGGAWLL